MYYSIHILNVEHLCIWYFHFFFTFFSLFHAKYWLSDPFHLIVFSFLLCDIIFTLSFFPFSFPSISYYCSMSWLEYDACLSIIKAIIVLKKSHFKCEELFFLFLSLCCVCFIYKSWHIELLFFSPNPECGYENGSQ